MDGAIYLDVYFLTNFVMDFLSLIVAGAIYFKVIKIVRAAIGGVIGAAFSVLILFVSAKWYINLFISVLSLFIMTLVSCGKSKPKKYLIYTAFVLVTDLFFGGAVEAIYFAFDKTGQSAKITLAVFILISVSGFTLWNIWGNAMKRKISTGVVFLTFSFGEKNVSCYGLIDSGNMVREENSNLPVILMKEETAKELIGEEKMMLMKCGAFPEKTYSIPIKSVGGEKELIGFMPNSVKLIKRNGKNKYRDVMPIIVAIDFSKGGFAGCPCLVPLAAV